MSNRFLIIIYLCFALLLNGGCVSWAKEKVDFIQTTKDDVVVLGRINQTIIAQMLIDTGASCTAVNQKTLDLLQIKPSGVLSIKTASCQTDIVQTILIPSITVGDYTVKNVRAAIIPNLNYDVMLGLNFFKNSTLILDFKNNTLNISN